MKNVRYARNRGSVAALAFVAVIPLVAAVGGFAVDCMHVNDAKGELQRATDAAALAGCEYLNKYKNASLPATATSQSASNEDPLNYALAVASMNQVDGPIGLWSAGQRSITATIRYDSTLGGSPTKPNRCDVLATIQLRSIFAQIFGNFGQTITTDSSAGLTTLNTIGGVGPLLVSLINDGDDGALNKLKLGDTFSITVKNHDADTDNGGNGKGNGKGNTDAVSNGLWIWNSNPDNQAAVDHITDPSKPFPDVPKVERNGVTVTEYPIMINDIIQSSNGNKSVDLDGLVGQDVNFLITDDNLTGYLSNGKPEHKVVGFMALHVTFVDDKGGKDGKTTVKGTLIQLPSAGGFNPGAGNPDPGLGTFIPYLAKLIK